MALTYIPEIEGIVLESCQDLIRQFNFVLQKNSKNSVVLLSNNCGIKISAAISPIGEEELDIDFFDPHAKGERTYFSSIFLHYINTRREPRDVMDECVKKEDRHQRYDNNFDETIRVALKCFTAHTLKYRQDILNGDFTSWLPKPES